MYYDTRTYGISDYVWYKYSIFISGADIAVSRLADKILSLAEKRWQQCYLEPVYKAG